MQKLVKQLQQQNAILAEQNKTLAEQNSKLSEQVSQLSAKINFLIKRLFGRRSEKLNPGQLELLLSGMKSDDDDDPPPSPGGPRRPRRRQSRPRLPDDLPTEEVLIDPEAVKQDPQGYECIGQEETVELDVVPARYFRRRIIRRKYRSKVNRDRPPLIEPLGPRVVESSLASPGLITDIILRKYVDHLPLYRQEQILKRRHGIELSRKTMCDWVGKAADWFTPIYNHIAEDLRDSGYLQIDETPILYCRKEGGGSGKGYLWLYHDPGGQILYQWYTGRSTDCLNDMLGDFSGAVQSDGYGAYISYANKRRRQIEAGLSDKPIRLCGCWAHARRKFYDALDECPQQAGWILQQIGLMYSLEERLKGQPPVLRQTARQSEIAMILARLEKAFKLKLPQHRPKSLMGEALSYALSFWPQLLAFRDDGGLEIDNNQVENAVQPTAIGKKNWLFFGHPDAGQRSAILYTIMENCKRLGINPRDYLCDVLSRIPSMTNQQTRSLTPANWLAERTKAQCA